MVTVQGFEVDSSSILDEKIIKELTPSTQKVYETIRAERLIGIKELEFRTCYSPRAVRYALAHLRELNLIIQIKDLKDARRSFYTLSKYTS